MDATTRLKISPHAFYQELEDQAVILNLKSEQYYTLDAVGRDMWLAIKTHESVSKATNALLLEYTVEKARLEEDLIELAAKLEAAGLLDVEND
ncbi:MAG: PqqD family protein [Sphaerospermopsis sp. SIO1G2]|nr:PqqD family protein [Sphaerospermopsis sp. SIO1G2]